MSAFGPLLRRARAAAGLSQADLAERSGISVREISYLESGHTRSPYRRTVRLLADALNLDAPARERLEHAARASVQASAHEEGQSNLATQATEVSSITPRPDAYYPDSGPSLTDPDSNDSNALTSIAENNMEGNSGSGQQSAFKLNPTARLPVPAQLPHDVPGFIGRDVELATLTRLKEQSAGILLISTIDGIAGIGKTALAVHWAHQVANQFPDGQLYINLRGFDPSGKPVAPAVAIDEFLDAFAIPPEDKPVSLDARTALYRSLLAEKCILIILDNAYNEQQVRPLLPGNPACVVIVTSRRKLGGLVAADGASILTLNQLTEAEADNLLARRLGREQITAEPQATRALIQFCAGLPLALAVIAARAATCPHLSLTELATELHNATDRLDKLDVGDPATSVRAAFSWTYKYLSPASARLFRLLGLHPGPDVTVPAVASLAEIPLEDAHELLRQLTQVSLLSQHAPRRFTSHDLVRAYARDLVDNDSAYEQEAALIRMFDYYLHTAAAAMDGLFPAEAERRPRVVPWLGPDLLMTDQNAALAWLDAERANLIAVARVARPGWPGHTIRLAATLFRYLDAGGHFSEAITVHGDARRAASQTGDQAAEAIALTNLGVVNIRQGQDQQAADQLHQALNLFREVGDQAGQARALHNLGVIDVRQGQDQQAADHLYQALNLFREVGERVGQVRTLSSLGFIERRHGRYQQATTLQQGALTLSREMGDRNGEAYALAYLGELNLRQGRYQQATSYLQQALTIFRETGDRNGEAGVAADLGGVDLQQGRYPQATAHLQQALTLYRKLSDLNGEAEALNGLGEVLLVTGLSGRARAQHSAALSLASQIGNKYEEARAHWGLARAYRAAGDRGQARYHQQWALTLYTGLGVPEAEQIRALQQ